MATRITDLFMYRWRYALGYSALGLLFLGLLYMVALYVPGGLSAREMETAVQTSGISVTSFRPEMAINLPYRILQRLSFLLFGLTPLSIKLPSLLLGFLTIVGLIILLRTWFKDNVAILTASIMVTTSQFLLLTQSGTPDIMYIFWIVWILVAAIMISRKSAYPTLWKVVLFGLASLSLYTPLSFYVLLALASAVVLHPHLRFIAGRLPKLKLAVALICALIIVAPLVYAVSRQPALGLTLLGVSDLNLSAAGNASALFNQYFNFMSATSAQLITPVYGLTTLLIAGLGLIRLFTTKYTARSYIISICLILMLIVLFFNPSAQYLTFVPVTLLVAQGMTLLFRRWYRLFPFNPYARAAGLVPLFILIASLGLSGIDRFTYGYRYDPSVASAFTNDLRVLNNYLNGRPRDKTAVLTSTSELPFYTAVAARRSNVQVGDTAESLPPADITIVTRSARQTGDQTRLLRIITDASSQQSDRFYIYKNLKK